MQQQSTNQEMRGAEAAAAAAAAAPPIATDIIHDIAIDPSYSAASPMDARARCRARPTVMLFGDSITQQSFSVEFRGWGAMLGDWYNRHADVINRGYSG
jgi:hypothetical protein